MPMKISSAAKRVDPAVARNSFLMNQLATPGLGSLLAGRYVAGVGQLLLAILGFIMVLGWFVVVAKQMYEQIEGPSSSHSVAWLGEIGGVTFAAAWFWALATSLSLLREAKTNQTH